LTKPHPAIARAEAFCARLGLRTPVLLAPMAGACPPSLSIAVAGAGGLGACGAVAMQPEAIRAWAREFRAGCPTGSFQLNLWIPEAPPLRDAGVEAAMRAFLERWGPAVAADAADYRRPDFAAQCEALLEAGPAAISSIMGLYPAAFVQRMKARQTPWIATVTTLTEARLAAASGADAVIAQGMEAGGHRGAFDRSRAERELVGLSALLPAVVDAVKVPVIAAGGIADGRAVAAALLLGASAVQVGTAFLRCPESKLPSAWADAIGRALPEETCITRAFSGRPGRTLATAFVRAVAAPDAPSPAPYPVQSGLTQPMRTRAIETNELDGMQAWAGQSAARATAVPAGEVARGLWDGARALLEPAQVAQP
jgi:nitronate monooxygenase